MKKVILAILDGIGYKEEERGNACLKANTPNLDRIIKEYPNSLLKASGEEVGLPKGQMGNSEIGHLTIGSGRIVEQSLQRINKEIENGKFYSNKELLEAMNHAKFNKSKLHILGLLSDGGVHSHIDHIFSLIKMAKKEGIKDLYIHVFLDGRDTLHNVGINYLNDLKKLLKEQKIGKIATISGRYYSMDREGMWDKVKLAYDAIVYNKGDIYLSYKNLIKKSYKKNIYDEFIKPTIIDMSGNIEEDDALIAANFRPDRLTELFTSLTNPNFDKFETKKFNNIKLVTMMPVDKSVICTNAYHFEEVNNTLTEILSINNYSILKIAETSKFPHVTHFIDGDKDIKLDNVTKIKVPRKEVDTYDMYPQMSAEEVTNTIKEKINDYDFILVNYANGDMVGHTGNMDAAVIAVEEVDKCVGRLERLAIDNNFTLILVADHGNCEEMLDENNNMLTTHTTNPVRFVVCNKSYHVINGKLSDIAPSIINTLNLKVPSEMTGDIIISELL